MKKFKSIYLILIIFFIVAAGLIIYWQINSKNTTVKSQDSNDNPKATQEHLDKNELIADFIKNSLSNLDKIKFDLPNDDNLTHSENKLHDQKKLIDAISEELFSLDLSLKDINSPNDITKTFETNPECEQKINDAKQNKNWDYSEKKILEKISDDLNKINTNNYSSDNHHIDNPVPNPEENQIEKKIMEKIKNLKQTILSNCDDNFSDWNNLKNNITESKDKNIQIQSDNFKPKNIQKKSNEEKLKIIETLEQKLNKSYPHLNELKTKKTIMLPANNQLLYQDISVNCENIKEEIQKLKTLSDSKIQTLKKEKKGNLKANVEECIELLSVLKEEKKYDFDDFKKNTQLRNIFYFFDKKENSDLKKIFSEYLKVITNNS